MRVILFSKMFKIWGRFQKLIKKPRKSFYFLENVTWIGSHKILLLRREDLLSAVGMVTNSPKMSDITNRETFSNSLSLRVMRKCDKSAAVQTSSVFETL